MPKLKEFHHFGGVYPLLGHARVLNLSKGGRILLAASSSPVSGCRFMFELR